MSVAIPSLRGAIAVPEWAKNELWRKAQAAPSLDLRFADFKSLVDAVTGTNLVTFSRASGGTYVGSDGLNKTATTDEPRFDHDPTTGESLGLLVEEQRSNLLLNSGTLSTQSVTVAAVDHALSFTGTGTVTLSGASTAGPLVGTGTGEANRVSLTFTPTAGSLTLTVSGTVTDAQLEEGSFPTSYIPTLDNPLGVTRAADVVSISGANFSSWYRQDEGTVFVDAYRASAVPSTDFPSLFDANDGIGSDNRLSISYLTETLASQGVRVGGVQQVNHYSGGLGGVRRRRIAGGFKENDFYLIANGLTGQAQSDTSGAMPSNINQIRIGVNINGVFQLNGTISRLTFWPQRLSDATHQTITQ